MKLFHSPKFSVEHISYTIPGGNAVKTSLKSFERNSKWGCRLSITSLSIGRKSQPTNQPTLRHRRVVVVNYSWTCRKLPVNSSYHARNACEVRKKPWTARVINALSKRDHVSGKKFCDPVVNYERNIREFNVSCTWTIRGILWQSCPGAHWHASSRIVTTSSRWAHEQFAHSSRPGHYILSWPKFWTFQNFRPDKSRSHDRLAHISRPFTTSLRTGATPVVPMRATESGKCQTSISVCLWYICVHTYF